MILRELVRQLNQRGYECVIKDTQKNGVNKRGIVMSSVDGIAYPILYVDDIIDDIVIGEVRFDDAVDMIINQYEQDKNCVISDYVRDPNWVRRHVQIAIQRTIEEEVNVVKRASKKFPGLEEYLMVIYDESKTSTSYKVQYGYAAQLNLDVDELWMIAYRNTMNESQMQSIAMMIGDFLEEEEMDSALSLFVVTNKIKYKGSGAILNDEFFKKLGKKFNCKKFVCMPSSIHEWLVHPIMDDNENLDIYHYMVHEANTSVVAPEEVLADRAFLVEI